jgi:hypothetical protein
MTRFFTLTAALGVFVVLTAAAVRNGSERLASPTAAPQAVPPLKLSDMALNRVFRQTLSLPAGGAPLSINFPPAFGIVLRSINIGGTFAGPNDLLIQVAVNGGAPESYRLGYTGGVYTVVDFGQIVTLDPPAVFRPGDSVTVTAISPAGFTLGPTPVTLGGYLVFPGEV